MSAVRDLNQRFDLLMAAKAAIESRVRTDGTFTVEITLDGLPGAKPVTVFKITVTFIARTGRGYVRSSVITIPDLVGHNRTPIYSLFNHLAAEALSAAQRDRFSQGLQDSADEVGTTVEIWDFATGERVDG